MAYQGFWTPTLEGTADRLNAGLLQRDTLANRPAAAKAGVEFFATDTKEWYRDNGATWDLIAPPSGITRAGSNNTEATTTSTTDVDILSITVTSIPAVDPILIIVNGRKTVGATAVLKCGLKLNATQVATVMNISANDALVHSGVVRFLLGARVTNYLNFLKGPAKGMMPRN